MRVTRTDRPVASRGACVALLSSALLAACVEAAPSQDAAVDVPFKRTVVLSVAPGVARPLPADVAAIPTPIVTSAPGQAGMVTVADGAIRYDGPPAPHPLVVRALIESATQRGVEVRAVLAVGGAVFTGAVDASLHEPANWDVAAGDPLDAPWVFVPETPSADAALPLPTVPVTHARDVLIDRGTTFIADRFSVEGARFECHGELVPHDAPEPMVFVTRGEVAGRVPVRLILEGPMSLSEPISASYLALVGGGTPLGYAIEPAATVEVTNDASIGNNATAALAGRLLVHRDLGVSGVLRTVAPTALAWLGRLDMTAAPARVEHDAGTIVVDTYASLDGVVSVAAGARLDARRDLALRGVLRNAGEVLVGRELRLVSGELTNTGTITYESCTQSPGAPPCP